MGAATRASTARALEALDGVLNPSLLGRLRGGTPDALGDELLAAARAIASSHQLTAVLTDVGIEPDQREALVKRVFGTRFERITVELLARMAGSRWSEPGDFVGAVEELGIRALAADSPEGVLEGELFTVHRAVAGENQLELALSTAASPLDARFAILDRLLTGADPAARSIVRHVVELPRGRRVVENLQRAARLVADQRGRLVATVHTAKALTALQIETLQQRLAARYGRSVGVHQVVDPALVGGVRITIGDDVIDGTVRSRLDDLRLALA